MANHNEHDESTRSGSRLLGCLEQLIKLIGILVGGGGVVGAVIYFLMLQNQQPYECNKYREYNHLDCKIYGTSRKVVITIKNNAKHTIKAKYQEWQSVKSDCMDGKESHDPMPIEVSSKKSKKVPVNLPKDESIKCRQIVFFECIDNQNKAIDCFPKLTGTWKEEFPDNDIWPFSKR
jgi:hypothetical protein